ncbi:MAG: TIGR00266 family protein [Clostridia bacterium]|nr:TIGR00266 family protein [Clostridia bacterium]
MNYEIKGESLPVLYCHLESGEKLLVEGGGMSWMTPNLSMETTSDGGFGKMVGRMFSGEKMFRNVYTANGNGMIAIASSFPGSIMAFDVSGGNDIVFQKHAYLASDVTVETAVSFSKKVGAGFFGGEGFVLQKASGRGMVFLEIDGSAAEYDLQPGQQIVVSTGNLAAMSATCKYDIQSVKGVKNKLLGGEGFFNTVITGPGKVILQSMPISAVAGAISPYIATGSSN